MKVILVDDEVKSLNMINLMLKKYCPQVDVIATSHSAQDALVKIESLQPDLVFLDISMPGESGFELLQQLTTASPEVIFVTAHSVYMLTAFKFSAVDYLLKPILEEDLINAVKRAGERVKKRSENAGLDTLLHNIKRTLVSDDVKLRIPVQSGFEVISLKDIIYGKAEGSYTTFYLADKTQVVSSRGIREYEEMLKDNFFVRIHKSYLINLRHLKKYQRGEGGTVILEGGNEIGVAKLKKDHLMAQLKVYFK